MKRVILCNAQYIENNYFLFFCIANGYGYLVYYKTHFMYNSEFILR